MNIKITGKNIEITEAIRDYVEKRLEKLEKFDVDESDINVVCSVEREEQIAEIQVNYNGEFIKIEEKNSDLYASIDLAMDRVERQIRKEKEKRSDKNKEASFKEKVIRMFTGGEQAEQGEITKTKCYEIKPLTVEDAKLKLLADDDMFLPFVNAEDNSVNIIYKRGDGTLGIVIPE